MRERKAVLRNAAVSSLGTYGEYILGLVVSVWVARALGPTEFGHYSFIIWLCGWLILASNHGLPMSAIKFIAEARGTGDADLAHGVASQMVRLQRISAGLVCGAFVAAAAVWRPRDWAGSVLEICGLVCIAVAAKSGYTMLAAIGKGYEQFRPEALAAFVAGAVNVLLVSTWSFVHGGVLGYLAAFAILSVCLNVGVRFQLQRNGIRPWAPGTKLPGALSRRIRRNLALTGGLVAVSSLTGRAIETLLLKATAPLDVVGYFAISGTLTKGVVDFLSSGLSATLLPAMSRAYGRGSTGALAAMLPNSVRFFWFLGLAIAGIGYLVSPGLVTLMFGAKYQGAVLAVQVSLCVAGLSLFAAPINAFQTTADLQGDRILITILTLIANAVVAGILIPTMGINGALLSLAATSTTYASLAVLGVRMRSDIRLPLRLMARMLAAALVALLAGSAANVLIPIPFGSILAGIVFAVVYLVLSVIGRCWMQEDLHLLHSLLDRFLSPRVRESASHWVTRFGART